VLTLLKHFGRPAGVDAAILDEITEASWVATTTEAVDALELVPDESMDAGEGAPRKASDKREHAQFLVQQCFEVAVPELPIDECVFAESDGSREYPIYYDKVTETPKCPVIQKEQESSEWIADYGLLQRNLNTPEMALICELAAKELEATKAFISVVQDNEQHSVAVQPSFECGALERSQTFCAFALTSPHPFLVRDAVLDIRFRNLNVVRGDAHTQFYLGFPIVAQATGITIAELCIIDTKPRQHITTMQYSIIKKLSSIVSTLWAESYRGSER
jgi:GAF domain-containing protein